MALIFDIFNVSRIRRKLKDTEYLDSRFPIRYRAIFEVQLGGVTSDCQYEVYIEKWLSIFLNNSLILCTFFRHSRVNTHKKTIKMSIILKIIYNIIILYHICTLTFDSICLHFYVIKSEILFSRVGIEPTTCRFYSHTLCPCDHDWSHT